MGRGHEGMQEGVIACGTDVFVQPDVTLEACQVGFTIGSVIDEEGVSAQEMGFVFQIPDGRFDNDHCEVLVRVPLEFLPIIAEAVRQLNEEDR